MTVALIDSDTPIFAAAMMSADVSLNLAKSRLDCSMTLLIRKTECSSHRLFVSGQGNFRKELYPDYKANRPRLNLVHRQPLTQHLIDEWGAESCDGLEADDLVGCEQTDDTMIVGIDKDLLMIPGKHYQWPLVRGGKEVRPGVFLTTTYIDGIRSFFIQSLTGDTSDNILRYFDTNSQTWKKNKWAIGDKKAKDYLEPFRTEEAMYQAVVAFYKQHGRLSELETVLDLLWIQRSYGETYSQRRLVYG